jgi:hypothetical protein
MILILIISLIAAFLVIKIRKYKDQIKISEEEKVRYFAFFHDTGNKIMFLSNSKDRSSPEYSATLNDIGYSIRDYAHFYKLPNDMHQNFEYLVTDIILEVKNTSSIKFAVKSKIAPSVEKRMLTEKKIIIYRIIKELIYNTVKHSHADFANIVLFNEGRNIVLDYSDNGKGMELAQLKGKGTDFIKEQVKQVNGEIDIRTAINEGFSCIIMIPQTIYERVLA